MNIIAKATSGVAAIGRAMTASMLYQFGRAVGVNTTGVQVDETTALSLPAAYCAINSVTTDLASLPLHIVLEADDGTETKARDHARYGLFARSPDGMTTSMRFRQALVMHAILWGDGYAEIVPSLDGSRDYLYLLHPGTTEPYPVLVDQTSRRWDVKYRVEGKSVDKERIIHLAGLGFNGLQGFKITRMAPQAFGLGLAAERYGGSYLGKGMGLQGFVKSPHDLTEDAADELLGQVTAAHSGPDQAGGVGLLPPGYDFVPFAGGKPSDAQLTELRAFQVLEMARLIRVPPHKVGDYTKASYSTIEAANLEYVQTTLLPWAEALEQSLNLRLLTEAEQKAGYTFRHDFRAFLRADANGRAALYRVLFNCSSITPNEIRAGEGMPPRNDPSSNATYSPRNMQGSNATPGAES